MINKTVTKNTPEVSLPWGVEVELVQGRCIYIGAKDVIASADTLEIVINDTNTISLPRNTIRKIMIMVTDDSGKEEKPSS